MNRRQYYNSPPPYEQTPNSSEGTPLLGKASKSRIRTALIAIITASTAIIIFASVFNPCNDPLDPDVRDHICKKWEFELHQHGGKVLERVNTEKRWHLEDNERIRLREQWGREVEDHNREVKERQRREEEERLRLNMFWIDLESHTCTSYATRVYTARLVNVPSNYNRRVEACMATPVQIHGAEYTPKWCEDHGPNDIMGHWEVEQQQPDCASYWNWYKDLGCVSPGSGQRRVEHYLENLPEGGDWREFCATTPVNFRGMHFPGAQFCFERKGGIYGHWVFDDERCK